MSWLDGCVLNWHWYGHRFKPSWTWSRFYFCKI